MATATSVMPSSTSPRRDRQAASRRPAATRGNERACLQDGCERAGKSGEHVLSVERAFGRHERLAAVSTIDTGKAAVRIEDPYEPRPGGEPIGDLGEYRAGTVPGRQDFHREVRCERGVSRRTGRRQSLARDEGDVRGANG